MPQITSKFLFYAFIIFQILLQNVTFINSAVIRREQRSIITNSTLLTSASAELEPATSIGLEDDDGNLLLEMPSFKDDTTTKNSLQDTTITTSSVIGEDKKEDTTLTGLRLDENTVGLSSDNGLKSSKVVMIEEGEKNKNEESTTMELIDKSTITKIEETTTIPPLVVEKDKTTSKKEEEEISTVFTASHETSTSKKEEVSTISPEMITSKKEEVSTISTSPLKTSTSKKEELSTVLPEIVTSKKEEVSTISTASLDTSTSKKEEELSTVSPEIVTSKKEEVSTISTASLETSNSKKEDEGISTAPIESSTHLKIDQTNDKTNKEDKSFVENSVDTSEDTTQIKSTSFEETTNLSASNTNMEINEATEVPIFRSTIPVINHSATKTTQSPSLTTNFKLEATDKVTEKLHVQNELSETSTTTELTDNDISKTLFVTNEHKASVIDEKKLVTTESILMTNKEKEKNVKKQKVTEDVKFTKPLVDETTQIPFTSTEELIEEHTVTIKTVDAEDLKKPLNEVKNSNSSSTEKRGKFIANNYSSFNDFHLPNTSDVWALASLRSVGKSKSSELQNSVETSEEKPSVNNSMATKSLHDWTRVMETNHSTMESKPFMRIVENTEDPTTEIATATVKEGTEPNTTGKTIDILKEMTTKIPIQEETTEVSLNEDNEVEILTTKVEEEPTTVTVAVTLKDKIEKETINSNSTESQNTNNDFETTTDVTHEMRVKETTEEDNPHKTTDDIIPTTNVNLLEVLTNHEKTIEENRVDGDSFEKETISLPTTTITTTTTTTQSPMPQIVTVKSETTESLANGEITQKTNAGTTSLSTSSLSDFTTSIPFLTSTTAITKKTSMEVMTDVITTSTPPVVILNTDDELNEPPSISSTHIISPVTVTINSLATTQPLTTTTTTTMPPAVTVMEEIIETTPTTTEAAPHTPAIISNDTMIQKNNNNNNYNEYEVVNKSTKNYADNSSTEAIEATTRVGLQSTNWSTNPATEILTTTEVDKLDEEEEDLDVTTAASFENTITSTTTVAGTVTLAPKTYPIVTDTVTEGTKTSTESLDHIDPIQKISETAETSIESNVIDPLQVGETSTAATATTTTTTTTTTESNQENMKMPSTTAASGDDESIYSILTTTTTAAPRRIISTTTTTSTPNYYDESTATTFESISTKKEDVYSIVPTMTIDNGGGGYHVPKSVLDDTTTLMPPGAPGIGGGFGGVLTPMDSPEAQETDVNVIIAISVSTVGIIALILLVAFLYVMRKRQKQMSYGQRCRPVSLDAYSLDNVSVYNSVRRKGATLRASKRSYGNVAFDDPSLRHNVLGTHELARYVEKKSSIWEEFKEVPQIIARADEVPTGCEDKNRYANVIPLPETRVILQQQNGDEKSEYINANYVRGPKDTTNYYIACQAPLETTVNDFWRMIWEQNSRVIIMATDLIENGIDKCAEYLPPSVTLDNHTVFGDYQVTLKHREVKEKYAISTLMLKNTVNDESREITHYWYRWPETGVPTDEAAIIAMLLEARSSLKTYAIEQCDGKIENSTVDDNSSAKIEINGNVTSEKTKPQTKDQGPLTIHCSPGTGRTGTILACDIAIRCLEEPKRTVDIPQIVYSVRRGRASAVQTKEQYEFIYKVTHMYATKITNINNDN